MSLPKPKKSERAVSLVPPWHPNFRDFERLPDVKVVRTSFFINAVAVVIALGLLSYLTLQEYKVHEIHAQISDLQSQINSNQKASDQAVQLYQKFKTEEAKAAEAEAFIQTDFIPSNFILEIARTLPKNITLSYIDINPGTVTLRGAIQGTPDKASGQVSAYIDELRSNRAIGPRFGSIDLTGLNAGSTGNGNANSKTAAASLNFELLLKVKKSSKS